MNLTGERIFQNVYDVLRYNSFYEQYLKMLEKYIDIPRFFDIIRHKLEEFADLCQENNILVYSVLGNHACFLFTWEYVVLLVCAFILLRSLSCIDEVLQLHAYIATEIIQATVPYDKRQIKNSFFQGIP